MNPTHKNSLIFTQFKIINSEKSELQNKATVTMRHAVMLLLLFRILVQCTESDILCT